MIDTELKFISRDTITEYKCDSIGEDRSKMIKSVCYLTGQIDLNGRIRISKLITEKSKLSFSYKLNSKEGLQKY